MTDTKLSALAQGISPATLYGIDGAGESKRYRGDTLPLNVKDFGATGDGSTDDRAAIQLAFDTAYGSADSPHGTGFPGKAANMPVYFPSGHYMIGAPLYLNGVDGATIFGNGCNSSILTYNGNPTAGNSVIANGITPLIMCNGFRYSSMSDIGLTMTGKTDTYTTCLYLFSGATTLGDGRHNQNQCIWQNMSFGSAGHGMLIGFETVNGLCSENTIIGCVASNCEWGFKNIDSNALNNLFFNCGASDCTVGLSAPSGQIGIYGGSFANNGLDIETGQNPIVVLGARTESANFLNMTGSTTVHIVMGCTQISFGSTPGNFADIGSCNVSFDGCVSTSPDATDGLIVGGGLISLRGCDFRNTSFLSSYVGSVIQNTGSPSVIDGLTNQFSAHIMAGSFSTSHLRDGCWMVGRDSSGNTTKLYYNNGGTLQSVTLT